MRINFEHNARPKGQRFTDLQNKNLELERQLSAARVSLRELDADDLSAVFGPAGPSHGVAARGSGGYSPEGRTEVLVNHGRRSAYSRGLSIRQKAVIAGITGAVIIAIVVTILCSGGPTWPSSVATVKAEAAVACQNPDVRSEPGQVDFACASSTRQILWVFALLTSHDNPNYADPSTGRRGLEPIQPAQGGEVAWFLNLHHPYNPANPVDSLQVAARAINNIIGGATLTGTTGSTVVQPGLESKAANCRRYTGSAALRTRTGFPSVCAKPLTSPAGEGALVIDLYKRWAAGGSRQEARDAAILFDNAKNPGNPQVQAILRRLTSSKNSA